MPQTKNLFNDFDVHNVRRGLLDAAKKAVNELSDDQLMAGSIEEVAERLVASFTPAVPELDLERAKPNQREVDFDVRHDPLRLVLDRSQPCYVKATEVSVKVPFIGDADFFRCQPSTFSNISPRGIVDDDHIIVAVTRTDHNKDAVQESIKGEIDAIQRYLNNLRNDVRDIPKQVEQMVLPEIQRRREKREKDRGLIDGLDFGGGAK